MNDKRPRPIVLAAFANDRVDHVRYLRNLAEEARGIRRALEIAESVCELVLLQNATLREILDAFQKYRDRVAIFHYGGHANGVQLLLEGADGSVQHTEAAGLAQFLAEQSGLELVFLNGCSTEPQVEQLLDAGVAAVVATTQSINDEVATHFAIRFYQGLATGAAVSGAYQEAVAEVRATSGGDVRAVFTPLDADTESDSIADARWPWLLRHGPGAANVLDWNLPEAAGDPLYGLPAVKPTPLPPDPYRHLQPYHRDHADVFFGRSHDIRELYQRIIDRSGASIILLFGQSGVGKSSLLNAGLYPRLEATTDIHSIRYDTERGSVAAVEEALTVAAGTTATAGPELPDHLIVVDQLEELYTRPHPDRPAEVSQLIQRLAEFASDPTQSVRTRIVLSFRKEWLAEFRTELAAAGVAYSEVFLERLNRRSVLDAIQGPAHSKRLADHFRLKIEPGLAETIADDLLRDPDTPVAPLLQIVLSRLWREAVAQGTKHRELNRRLYGPLRRHGLLLHRFIDEQLAVFDERDDELGVAARAGMLLDVLYQHTGVDGTAETCDGGAIREAYADRIPLLEQMLADCIDRNLLFELPPASRGQLHRTRLLHDTLAPTLRQRFEESARLGQQARRILEQKMAYHGDEEQQRPLDRIDLKRVEQGAAGMRAWTHEERELIAISRRARRVAVATWAGVSSMLSFACILIIILTLSNQHESELRAETERANQYLQSAERLARLAEHLSTAGRMRAVAVAERDLHGRDLEAGQHLRAAAASVMEGLNAAHDELSQTRRTDLAREAEILQVGANWLHRGLQLKQIVKHDDWVNEAWLLPDGRLLTATGGALSGRDQVYLWPVQPVDEAAERGTPQLLIDSQNEFISIRKLDSPYRFLAWDRKQLWRIDLSSTEPLQAIDCPALNDLNPEFLVDALTDRSGSRLVVATNDNSGSNRFDIVDIVDGQATMSSLPYDIQSSRGHRIVESDQGPLLVVWGAKFQKLNLADKSAQFEDIKYSGAVADLVAFSDPGPWLVLNSDLTLSRFDGSTAAETDVFSTDFLVTSEMDLSYTRLRLSPDERRLVMMREKQSGLMDANEFFAIGPTLHTEQQLQDAQFSPDGRFYLTWDARTVRSHLVYNDRAYCPPSTLQLWDAETGMTISGRMTHGSSMRGARFSDDSRHIVSWTEGGHVLMWHVALDTSLDEIVQSRQPDCTQVQLSPSETRFLTVMCGPEACRIFVRDLQSGRDLCEPIEVPANASSMLAAAFGDSEDEILAWTQDKRIRWKIADQTARQVEQAGFWHPGSEDQTELDIVLSSQRKYAAIVDSGQSVEIWNVDRGQSSRRKLTQDSIEQIAFSPDDKIMATWGAFSPEVRLWEPSGRPLRTPEGDVVSIVHPHGEGFSHVVFSSESDYLLTAASPDHNTRVRVWETRTGQRVGPEIVFDNMAGAHFLRGAKSIVLYGGMSSYGASGGQVEVVDFETGESLAFLPHDSRVVGVSLTADESLLACWGSRFQSDNRFELRVWDWRNEIEVIRRMNYRMRLGGAFLTSDGLQLISWEASEEDDVPSRVYRWKLPGTTAQSSPDRGETVPGEDSD